MNALFGDLLWSARANKAEVGGHFIMKTSNSLKIIGGVAAAVFLAASQALAVIAYDFTGVVQNEGNAGPLILGNVFTVNSGSSINVTAVGTFESGGSLPGGVTVPVAIYGYNGSTWTQVGGTSESFTSGSLGTQVGGNTGFTSLTSPVTLTPGTYAIVGASYGANYAPNYDGGGSLNGSLPSFNNGSGAMTMGSTTLGYTAFGASGTILDSTITPSFSGSFGAPSPAWAGATFEFDLTPVPEAAAFGAAGVGLLGLVYIGRFACLRRKLKLA